MLQNPIEDLQEIRRIMERSGKFTPVSGWSGILAGMAGLAGAAAAFLYFDGEVDMPLLVKSLSDTPGFGFLVMVAMIVLLLASLAGLFMTIKVARLQGQSVWTPTSRLMLLDFAIPMALGGIFCAGLVLYQIPGLLIPTMLLFYGMALINASHKTLNDLRYLGYCQLAVGISCLLQPAWGFWFWTLGFGILHLIYGLLLLLRYSK
jgi:hypothetical protein